MDRFAQKPVIADGGDRQADTFSATTLDTCKLARP